VNYEKYNTKTSYTEISDGEVCGCDIPVGYNRFTRALQYKIWRSRISTDASAWFGSHFGDLMSTTTFLFAHNVRGD